jgi:hypothetical protein
VASSATAASRPTFEDAFMICQPFRSQGSS